MRKPSSVLRVFIAFLPLLFVCLACSQAQSNTPPSPPNIQMLQQAAFQNAQQLRAYQWIETTTTTVQGHAMPARKMICRFAPDGTLTRTPLDPQQSAAPQMKGGPLMRQMEQKKMGGIKEEMTQVHELVAMYLPLNPDKLAGAAQPNDGTNMHAVILSDYAKSGDEVKFSLDSKMQQIQGTTVKTYFDTQEDPLTISMQFSKLDDGTTYPSITTINAPAKKISITTTSSDFSKPVQ